LFFTGRGTGGEWVTNDETKNFWIQVKCPDLDRVWKIALRARDQHAKNLQMEVRGFNRL